MQLLLFIKTPLENIDVTRIRKLIRLDTNTLFNISSSILLRFKPNKECENDYRNRVPCLQVVAYFEKMQLFCSSLKLKHAIATSERPVM